MVSVLSSLFWGQNQSENNQEITQENNQENIDIKTSLEENKKQTLRKNKKHWRNIDLTDIDNAQTSIERETILLGKPINLKTNEELFSFDTDGSNDSKNIIKTKDFDANMKSLRSYQVLENSSKVESLTSVKRSSSTKSFEIKVPITNSKINSIQKVKKISKQELNIINNVKKNREIGARKNNLVSKGTKPKNYTGMGADIDAGIFDPWDEENTKSNGKTTSSISSMIGKDNKGIITGTGIISLQASKLVHEINMIKDSETREYLEPTLQLLNPKVRKPNLPAVLTNTNSNVEVAHPGASYNPTFNDHQSILQEALDAELAKEAYRLKYQIYNNLKNLRNIDSPMDVDAYEDDDEENKDEEKENEENDDTLKDTNKKEIKQKTRTERNKERKAKELQEIKEFEKQERKLIKDINRIHELNKQVEDDIKKQEMKTLKKQTIENMKDLTKRRMRLGRYHYKPLLQEIKLTEELTDSLRRLVPEGSVVRDRFNSLQKRNLIETRKRVGKQKRRYKLKTKEIYSYRHFK